MRKSGPFSALRLISLLLLLIAVVLTTMELARFSRLRSNLPAGQVIAGVPVGGLSKPEVIQRLLEIYSSPVELVYNGSSVQLDPGTIDYKLDTDSMVAQADVQRVSSVFWVEFWDYLWNRSTTTRPVPLSSSFSEERLSDYLADLGARYNVAPQAPAPLPGTNSFAAGQPGLALDPDASIRLIELALDSLNQRTVTLPLQRTSPPRPDFRNLEILLQQILDNSDVGGLAGLYLLDLQSGQEIHFARQDKENFPVNPDIAFTASSMIKIPILVSIFRRLGENTDQETLKLIADMIERSANENADLLMERILDPNLGPLMVTEDIQKLGLENTFMGGEFTFGSPLLQRFDTPANSRQDIFTDPDPYAQTTLSDIGMLLDDLYKCAETGGGALPTVFPGEIDQAKCQRMITHLINNRLPVLLTAGLPEGTKIAHKHGWVSTGGIINTIGDAGIIYSPGGDYVLVVFYHHPDQLVWEPASELIAILSQAVYNYYNPPSQTGS